MKRRGLFGALRRDRASWSIALVFALLFPLVLGLLPRPAESAESRLLQALAISRCSERGLETTPGGAALPGQHAPDCLLCMPGCPMSGHAALGAADFQYATMPVRVADRDVALPLESRRTTSRFFDSGPSPRGPPVV